MRIFDHIRLSILRKVGLEKPRTIEEIEAEQWSPRFVQLQKHRMVFGYFRYGPMIGHVARWDNIRSAISRLEAYLLDGNLEHLVDVANLCLLEFVKGPLGYGSHPSPKWQPQDDGYHTKEIDH